MDRHTEHRLPLCSPHSPHLLSSRMSPGRSHGLCVEITTRTPEQQQQQAATPSMSQPASKPGWHFEKYPPSVQRPSHPRGQQHPSIHPVVARERGGGGHAAPHGSRPSLWLQEGPASQHQGKQRRVLISPLCLMSLTMRRMWPCSGPPDTVRYLCA